MMANVTGVSQFLEAGGVQGAQGGPGGTTGNAAEGAAHGDFASVLHQTSNDAGTPIVAPGESSKSTDNEAQVAAPQTGPQEAAAVDAKSSLQAGRIQTAGKPLAGTAAKLLAIMTPATGAPVSSKVSIVRTPSANTGALNVEANTAGKVSSSVSADVVSTQPALPLTAVIPVAVPPAPSPAASDQKSAGTTDIKVVSPTLAPQPVGTVKVAKDDGPLTRKSESKLSESKTRPTAESLTNLVQAASPVPAAPILQAAVVLPTVTAPEKTPSQVVTDAKAAPQVGAASAASASAALQSKASILPAGPQIAAIPANGPVAAASQPQGTVSDDVSRNSTWSAALSAAPALPQPEVSAQASPQPISAPVQATKPASPTPTTISSNVSAAAPAGTSNTPVLPSLISEAAVPVPQAATPAATPVPVSSARGAQQAPGLRATPSQTAAAPDPVPASIVPEASRPSAATIPAAAAVIAAPVTDVPQIPQQAAVQADRIAIPEAPRPVAAKAAIASPTPVSVAAPSSHAPDASQPAVAPSVVPVNVQHTVFSAPVAPASETHSPVPGTPAIGTVAAADGASPTAAGHAEGALPHSTLSATPTSLEVGVSGGTHGWLKIRAELSAAGEANVSLTGTSPAATSKLQGDLPAMNSFLASEKVAMGALNVNSALHAAGATVSSSAAQAISNSSFLRSSTEGGSSAAMTADTGAGGRAQGQSQGNHQAVPQMVPVSAGGDDSARPADEVLLGQTVDRGSYGNQTELGGSGLMSSVEYGAGGGWLNVRV